MLKKQFLVPTIAGDCVAAVGVSEPGAGSDVSAITTTAIRSGDDLIINGTKMWITNGMQADWICLLANTSQRADKHKNKSLICVPTKSRGIHRTKIDKLGLKSSDTAIINFENVRVPQANIIGEEGMGFTYQMLQFQEERILACAGNLPRLSSAIQVTIDYCRQRHTFGKPVLHNQHVHFTLAELATEVELLRALLYQTAKLYNQGYDVTKWASMCKLKIGRLSRTVSDTCLQFWGGMGYTNEVHISRLFRDSRILSIAGGSDEMMLTIIKFINMHKLSRLLNTSGKRLISKRLIHLSASQNASDCIVENSFYSPQHIAIQESVTKLIEKEINPFIDEWEEKRIFPAKELFPKLGKAGLLGINKPVEYGGQGLDYTYQFAFLEALGNINAGGVSMGICIQTDVATPALARFGSDKLKKDYLAPSIAGEIVSCLGVSEPGAGSDVAGLKTNAVSKGDDYIINGSKMWTTNGCQADWMCLLANTSDGPVHKNKSLIIVPMNTPGVRVARNIEKLGMHSSDTGEIYFDDVRVPKSNLVGNEGEGFLYQMLQFQEERLCGVALTVKSLQRVIKDTIEYCRQRQAFGQPILYNQSIYFRLAELQTEVEALRALAYKTVELYKEGNDVTKWTSMCKLKAGRLQRIVSDACLQYWGGMGYTKECRISRSYRDGRLLSIGAGADEIMLLIISKYMNMLPNLKKK
ncbi:hypothetical protein CHUAL_000772 [Chamberlinius hualienensis]